MRIGHGYDAHRFCDNKQLVIGGVKIDYCKGLLAHSDGDVLLHAISDSLLGAAGFRDIGFYFPDTDSNYKNIDSSILLSEIKKMLDDASLSIEYIDCTVIAQKPKLSSYIEDIRNRISDVLSVDVKRVNVKATTEEKMGFTGREEGIAAHCVCLLKEDF